VGGMVLGIDWEWVLESDLALGMDVAEFEYRMAHGIALGERYNDLLKVETWERFLDMMGLRTAQGSVAAVGSKTSYSHLADDGPVAPG